MRRLIATGTAVVALLLGAAGCGTATGSGTGGAPGVSIADARIPEPASPDVAAAYLTIRNRSSRPDVLETARASVSPLVSLHRTVEDGGVSSMVASGPLTIPSHGTVRLTPGSLHLMIGNARPALRTGQRVTLTLVFRRAGVVRVTARVVDPTDALTGS